MTRTAGLGELGSMNSVPGEVPGGKRRFMSLRRRDLAMGTILLLWHA
jgi:hypothetical protein